MTAVTAVVALAIEAVVMVVVWPASHGAVVVAAALALGCQMVTVAPAHGPSQKQQNVIRKVDLEILRSGLHCGGQGLHDQHTQPDVKRCTAY